MTFSPHLRRGGEALSQQAKSNVVPIPRRPVPKKKDAPKATYTYGARHPETPVCWFKQFSSRHCAGELEHAHLIEQQKLRKLGLAKFLGDPAVWEYGCHRHHFDFDARLRLFVPRSSLSEETERFAARFGLEGYLDERYGAREALSA